MQMPVMGGLESSKKILELLLAENRNNESTLKQKMETSIVVISAFTD